MKKCIYVFIVCLLIFGAACKTSEEVVTPETATTLTFGGISQSSIVDNGNHLYMVEITLTASSSGNGADITGIEYRSLKSDGSEYQLDTYGAEAFVSPHVSPGSSVTANEYTLNSGSTVIFKIDITVTYTSGGQQHQYTWSVTY